MSDRPPMQQLWAQQPTDGFSISLEEVRTRSAKFQRIVRYRNLIEYLAAAVVVPSFGWYVWVLPGFLTKLGSALIIVAALYVCWQLHKRGSAQTPPVGDSVMGHLAFYRGQLIRQREALKSVPLWYLAPFVPGMALFIAGISIVKHSLGTALAMSGLMLAVFAGVWFLNVWVAGRLQTQIAALDRLNEPGGNNA